MDIQMKKRVCAERIESVTIYHSDIVDFTSIVNESAPLEIVTFLNSLYKLFDARIDKYQVYKVHTINDSFMIASGIPGQVSDTMGDRHGSEIGTLALDLLAGSALFVIPHRPRVKIIANFLTILMKEVNV